MDGLRQWTTRGKHRFPADTGHGTGDVGCAKDDDPGNDETPAGDESGASVDGSVDRGVDIE